VNGIGPGGAPVPVLGPSPIEKLNLPEKIIRSFISVHSRVASSAQANSHASLKTSPRPRQQLEEVNPGKNIRIVTNYDSEGNEDNEDSLQERKKTVVKSQLEPPKLKNVKTPKSTHNLLRIEYCL